MESSNVLNAFLGTGSVPGYMLTKVFLQRGLALTYLVAFLVALNQFRPLLGEHGLLPVPQFLKTVKFTEAPSLFFWAPKDWAFAAAAWLGIVISVLALLGVTERFGAATSIVTWSILWVLYLSFVNVGQTFYAFGWESLLLEAGFFAIFLGPAGVQPPFLIIILYRWLLFRVMFGAGLIKLRGDSCWRDLTCLFYHFETQPIPNPLSWFFHWLPRPMLRLGVLYNHFAELIAPFGVFLTQRISTGAGVAIALLHVVLLASGNFSWLSFLTLVLTLSAFDDRALSFFSTKALAAAIPSPSFAVAAAALFGLVALLSYFPIRNLLSKRQAMNLSYNPIHIAGTYGAFGSITRPRYEVIVEGTDDADITPRTKWREYAFKGKPGDVGRMPAQIAPSHLRLDWLMWFAAFTPPQYEPWFAPFLAKLLQNDDGVLKLIADNPFPDRPPRFVRALRYEYRFSTPQERRDTGAWWVRTPVGQYFPAISIEDAERALPGYLFAH